MILIFQNLFVIADIFLVIAPAAELLHYSDIGSTSSPSVEGEKQNDKRLQVGNGAVSTLCPLITYVNMISGV